MGNDVSYTRKRFSSRHMDDDATSTSINERTAGGELKLSDAVGILIDNLCGDGAVEAHRRKGRAASGEEDPTVLLDDEMDTVVKESPTRRPKQENDASYHEGSYKETRRGSYHSQVPQDTETHDIQGSFCYFTKNPIGPTTPHYQGINSLSGNLVYMLPGAMDLKGCPTICDEDLRKLEYKYPNLFMRLPDELVLSSGWKRVSKFCYFSGYPIPDGSPFFHSKAGKGPYYLLASAIGMTEPSDVEPLTRDLLVLLQTDFPTQCDAAPPELIENSNEWVLVDSFCFFSGGPINPDEDIHYVSKLNGNPIYMLAFLSPNLTAEELYRLNDPTSGLKTVQDVLDVEHIYDLTDLDFHELEKYHLGKCRELPSNLLAPKSWKKVLPQHFLIAREKALKRASQHELKAKSIQDYEHLGNRGAIKGNHVRSDLMPEKTDVTLQTLEAGFKQVQNLEQIGSRGSIKDKDVNSDQVIEKVDVTNQTKEVGVKQIQNFEQIGTLGAIKYKNVRTDQITEKTDFTNQTQDLGLKQVQKFEQIGIRGAIKNKNVRSDQITEKIDITNQTQEVGFKYVQIFEQIGTCGAINDSHIKPEPSPEKKDFNNQAQETNKSIHAAAINDRTLVQDEIVESYDETTFSDIQEEGAFTKLHPMDEINFSEEVQQGSTQSVQVGDCIKEDEKYSSPSTMLSNTEPNEERASGTERTLNRSSSQVELLTSYIDFSEALTFDYEQELSLGSYVGNSLSSSLNSTPARNTNTTEYEYGHEKISNENNSQVSSYHNPDAGQEYSYNISNKNDDHGHNLMISVTQSTSSNENREIDSNEGSKKAKTDLSDNGVPAAEKIQLMSMEGNNILTIGQGRSDKSSERATTDPSPSSAMRVAQELLRKNRMKRQDQSLKSEEIDQTSGQLSNGLLSLESDVLYDHGCNPIDSKSDLSRSDKNSRRALILQLAKTRIKSQNTTD